MSNVSNTAVMRPVIPAEVADAIESCRANGANNATIIEYTSIRYTSERLVALRSIPFDTLLAALVNGYEREMTEEERREAAIFDIREMYIDSRSESTFGNDYFADGMKYVLDTLGIKIEGVNA